MAYAALVSFAQTLEKLVLNHRQYSISHREQQEIRSMGELLISLQKYLDDFPENASDLEGRIRDVANKAEDIIEYFMWEKIRLPFRWTNWRSLLPANKLKFSFQLKKIRKEIDSITKKVMEIQNNTNLITKDDWQLGDSVGAELMTDEGYHQKQKKYSYRSKHAETGAGSSDPSSSSAAPIQHEVVGIKDDVLAIRERLCWGPSKLQVIPICGMGGIGKTTLAKNVYNDPSTVYHFDVRVWVTISQDYSAERIISTLLGSMKELNSERLDGTNDEKVHKILMGRRYLVVMDDMWSSEAWDVVRNIFPDVHNGSRIILTTRLSDVASYPDPSSDHHEMSFMNAYRSWDLLKKKVFMDENCPSELESIGKEIARSCKGLPLAIVVIGGVLSTVSKNPTSWRKIAYKVKLAGTAEKWQIEEILSLSYTHLPQMLRPCFLYMGLFPEDHEIRASKLTKLWVAEGFLRQPSGSRTLEDEAEACLEDLIKRSLALVSKRKSNGRIKHCRLHDLMRDMCIRIAYETKFFLNLMDRSVKKEHFIERTKDQRRISVDSSSLMHLSSNHGSTIHTLVCSRNHEVVPDFLKSVRLLRVLDAEPADMISLPSQLFELFHLKYLAFRYNYRIPRSISKLQNLQTLIIRKENKDKFYVGIPFVRHINEIWKMPQLRHLYSDVIIFLDYQERSTTLENLQTLTSLSCHCCTERIFKMIPNLKKLAIDCLGHCDRGKVCLKDLVYLHQLENLEIHAGRPANSRPVFYSITYLRMLRKLSLISLRIPWDEMSIISSLSNLQVLKIRKCSGIGVTWQTIDGEFLKLEFLLVESWNLKYWITESGHFPSLRHLMLFNCHKLDEIPEGIGEIPTLELIKVKGFMKTSLEKSLTNILKEQQATYGNYALQVKTS